MLVAGTKNLQDRSANVQELNVASSNVHVHENFSYAMRTNDVALLHLIDEQLFESDTVKPSRLLTSKMNVVYDVKCAVAGWGHNETRNKRDRNGNPTPEFGERVRMTQRQNDTVVK